MRHSTLPALPWEADAPVVNAGKALAGLSATLVVAVVTQESRLMGSLVIGVLRGKG